MQKEYSCTVSGSSWRKPQKEEVPQEMDAMIISHRLEKTFSQVTLKSDTQLLVEGHTHITMILPFQTEKGQL